MNIDQIAQLEKSLPPILARSEVPKLTGGMISSGRLANLDYMGQGPRKVTMGRRVGYLRADFIRWMRSRNAEVIE